MATNTSPGSAAAPPALPQIRPLRREGAVILPTAAERALEEAMLRSSPEPDPSDTLLGKRTRGPNDDSQDGNDTELEPDEDSGTPPIVQSSTPTLSNIRAATLRYASQKKLRTEQRGELDAFLRVSTSLPDLLLMFE